MVVLGLGGRGEPIWGVSDWGSAGKPAGATRGWCLSVGNRNQLGPTQPVGLPLRRSDQHSWDPNHLQSTGRRERSGAGGRAGEPRGGLRQPRPRRLLCSLGRGRTDRQTDSQDCVSCSGRASSSLRYEVKSLVGRWLH